MSAEMGSGTNTIYVRLLNEGTPVMRPTNAVHLGNDVYRVLATDGYDPDDEEWEFVPGTLVHCVHDIRGGDEVLIAHKPAAWRPG
jgi:hypothetical protein